jgi:hypothetical protein
MVVPGMVDIAHCMVLFCLTLWIYDYPFPYISVLAKEISPPSVRGPS